ncbi:glutaredoxin 3 [Permianibacter sp. IMCC34836]|uniref:glutaredoxin 3 n=1 Tax=Permianibacter fluminis TaxID=2738515 RepID=UPI001551D423|nr:glutaredoxin 3 [Permianibacter fluminis]NQD36193.1 glutaredoxin 3 [Permianibacter fluminis]
MAAIEMFTTAVCPYCVRAKQLLDSLGASYQEIRVDTDPARRDEMMSRSGRRTVPQIFINGQPVGGCDDLYALHRAGKLQPLLSA